MKRVSFPLLADETERVVNAVNCVTDQIKDVQKMLPANDIMCDDKEFQLFFYNVRNTLNFWTGNTYVGHKKDESIQNAFQAFFTALYNFLLFCRQDKHCFSHPLKAFADKALYQGTIYRYLGHCSGKEKNHVRVEPEFNNIYVSWSKKPNNNYILSKLYGTKTLLTCNIEEPFYGIDLEVFEVVRGAEAEVVFPTLEKTLTSIEYIE